MNEGDDYATGE